MVQPRLEGKIAVVTGGGTGLGRALVLGLAERGAAGAFSFWKRARGAQETAGGGRAARARSAGAGGGGAGVGRAGLDLAGGRASAGRDEPVRGASGVGAGRNR